MNSDNGPLLPSPLPSLLSLPVLPLPSSPLHLLALFAPSPHLPCLSFSPFSTSPFSYLCSINASAEQIMHFAIRKHSHQYQYNLRQMQTIMATVVVHAHDPCTQGAEAGGP